MLKDVAALLGRLGLGVVFIAHGSQKLFEYGPAATAASFDQMGIPLPTLSAWFTTAVELGGGILFILGVALPVVSALLAFTMFGALFLVHLSGGLIGPQGFEYVLVLAVAALAIGFNGGSLVLSRFFKNSTSREPVAG
ncbi:DoxX family protein [Saccharothrix violaceirubra]|uniref:Putative oxidoreductase n=1 Tax=Saccharothrix violaceirubra TaxID=413306 RepID=A0A7W7SYA5_9PSEU|nr:DoxX family protein [Saccharothrix violaceirubra]MBB4963145.1 putative oxidoreductase [Saccharothrix violaceirubra]